MSKLVIVESPAKAKTIKQFLGKNYNVQASYGHIRDLPSGAQPIIRADCGLSVENLMKTTKEMLIKKHSHKTEKILV